MEEAEEVFRDFAELSKKMGYGLDNKEEAQELQIISTNSLEQHGIDIDLLGDEDGL